MTETKITHPNSQSFITTTFDLPEGEYEVSVGFSDSTPHPTVRLFEAFNGDGPCNYYRTDWVKGVRYCEFIIDGRHTYHEETDTYHHPFTGEEIDLSA